MYILQIVTQMEGGGSQRCAVLTSRELLGRGHKVETCFLFRRRGIYDDEPGAFCLSSEDPHTIGDYLRIFWRLFQTIQQRRPDGVLTFTHYSNVLGCLFALFAGIRNRVARQTGLPQHNPLLARVCDYVLGSIGVYTSIVANSNTTLRAFSNYPQSYRKRLNVVPNGIEPVQRKWIREEARSGLGLPLGGFIFASVGRLSASKNHQRLLVAISNVKGAHLVCAGDGEERQALEAQIQNLGLTERVTLLGDITADRLAQVYAAADAFVHPTLFESFGIVALEAAAAGLPLVLSDIPAMRELTGGPDAGKALYFNPTDITEITAAMTRIVEDTALRTTLAAGSPALAVPYGVPAMADGFLASLSHRAAS